MGREHQQSTEEQISRALRVAAQALQLHVMSVDGNDSARGMHAVSALAFRLCEHVQMPNYALLQTLVVRYFLHLGTQRTTVSEFAQELSSFVWALCYATPERLLQYVIEVYNDSRYDHRTISNDMSATIIRDMYSFFQQPYEDVVRQLREFVAARDECSSPADGDSARRLSMFETTSLCSCTSGSDGPPSPVARSKSATFGAAPPLMLPPLRVKSCDLKATQLIASPKSRQRRVSNTTLDTLDDALSTASSCFSRAMTSPSPVGEHVPTAREGIVPVSALVKFLKLRSSKFWPLITLQARLRSVFFGAQYWSKAASSLESEVLAFDESLFLFVASLRSLYLPERTIPGFYFDDNEEDEEEEEEEEEEERDDNDDNDDNDDGDSRSFHRREGGAAELRRRPSASPKSPNTPRTLLPLAEKGLCGRQAQQAQQQQQLSSPQQKPRRRRSFRSMVAGIHIPRCTR